MENAIEVRDLVLRYRILNKMSIRSSLFKFKKSKTELFEAIRGISFDVEKGQIMGIVGKNGSGKSTLLKTLSGIFSPDEGSIDMHGHSVSLMSIGVGFQKDLTGRENIYLSGMLLGFSEEEIAKRVDEIIEFSELGKFIDRPVRTYSSGMHSKLAFSITSTLKTDIMLIDEVLSVGDAKFRKKSRKRMKELIRDKDRTVIIVSHNIENIRTLCDSVLWIHEGKIKMQGTPEEVLPVYEEFMA